MPNFLAIFLTSLGVLGTMIFGSPQPKQNLGAAVPVIQALFETSLQAAITSNATSATMVSGTDFAGNSLSGYFCFTIDAGTVQNEFTCGNASGTALTNLTRGVNPLNGISSNTPLQFSHRRGADVKQTDAPYLSIYSNIFNGTQSVPAVMSYDATTYASNTISSNLENFASVRYVNSVASSGAPNATTGVKGLVQLSTSAQVASGTAIGSTGASLVPDASLFGATSSARTQVPVTGNNGKLSPGFIDQTANYNWSGNSTSSGTNAFTGLVSFTNTVSFDSIPSGFWGRQIFTTSSTWTVPAGVTRIFITGIGSGGGGAGSNGSVGFGGGGSGSWIIRIPTSTTPGTTLSIIIGNKGLGSLSSTSTPSSGSPTSVGSWLTLNGGQMASTTSGGVATTTILNGIALTGNSSAGSNASVNTGGAGANITSGAWICLGGTAGNSGGGPGGNSLDGYGCGGGGGGGNGGTIGRGGDGAPSIVIIEY